MLQNLKVRDFRCFESAEVCLHESTTLLLGRNGQGKTSLLEAACMLLRLQSPRTQVRQNVIRFGCSRALTEGGWHDRSLRFVLSARARRLAVDGAVCGKVGDYLEQSGRVVWMDHADMGLLRGGGDQRRRFLDFVASQTHAGYLQALRGYERALRGRNHILKRDPAIHWKEADAFAAVMADYAMELVKARRRVCEAMLAPVIEMHRALSRGNERAELRYEASCEPEAMVETLRARRVEEGRVRATLCGPHRDEVALLLNGVDATTFASEGQQRTLSLAMKLAQARVLEMDCGEPPLILIDDVFGELDADRRRAFMDHLPEGSQKILTTTQIGWMKDGWLEGMAYCVEQGRVEQFDPGA